MAIIPKNMPRICFMDNGSFRKNNEITSTIINEMAKYMTFVKESSPAENALRLLKFRSLRFHTASKGTIVQLELT